MKQCHNQCSQRRPAYQSIYKVNNSMSIKPNTHKLQDYPESPNYPKFPGHISQHQTRTLHEIHVSLQLTQSTHTATTSKTHIIANASLYAMSMTMFATQQGDWHRNTQCCTNRLVIAIVQVAHVEWSTKETKKTRRHVIKAGAQTRTPITVSSHRWSQAIGCQWLLNHCSTMVDSGGGYIWIGIEILSLLWHW